MHARWKFWIALVLFFAPQQVLAGGWQHALTLYGEPKYPSYFTHYQYVNPNAPKGGTLKMAYLSSFDSVNPYILKGLSAPGMNMVYQSLMEGSYDEPQTMYPLIASKVRVAEDRATAEFMLNPKARWSDGVAITAEDVRWSFETLKKDGHPIYALYYAPIEKVEVLSPHRVKFIFAAGGNRDLPLTAASMPILPKHYFEKVPFARTSLQIPVGSGPYKIEKIDAGRSITFTRDKNYWAANLPTQRGRFNFDRIHFDVYRDDVVAVEAIKSGQIDYYEEYIARNFATAYNIPAVERGELLKLGIPHKIPRGMQGFIFNLRKQKFADPRVREAIGLTMDYEWMNKRLFYGAYVRNTSFFQSTEFAATGLPSAAEKTLLEPYKSTLPSALFTTPYAPPVTDGTGYARPQLIRAQELLNEAGWVMRDGVRVNSITGEPLTIEFLMTQRTFERVIGIMRKNLKKLGIDSTFRYVDTSQYQKRVDNFDFDMISIWWNQGLHFPGTEQQSFWHSAQATVKGSQNLSGMQDPLIDDLVIRINRAQSLAELVPAARALDRVLLWKQVVIPHWSLNKFRMIHWNKFGKPAVIPSYNNGLDSWWYDPSKRNASKSPRKRPRIP